MLDPMVCIGFPHRSLRFFLLNILNGTKKGLQRSQTDLSADFCTIEVLFGTEKYPLQEGCCPYCRRCFL